MVIVERPGNNNKEKQNSNSGAHVGVRKSIHRHRGAVSPAWYVPVRDIDSPAPRTGLALKKPQRCKLSLYRPNGRCRCLDFGMVPATSQWTEDRRALGRSNRGRIGTQ